MPTIFLFLGLLLTPVARAINDPLTPPGRGDDFSFSGSDKQFHLAGGYAFAFTGAAILARREVPRWEALLYSGIATTGIGLAKEIFFDSTFSRNDMAFTMMGIAAAGLTIYVFDLFPPPPAVTSAASSPSP